MTEEQFDKFLKDHPAVEHTLDENDDSILFKDPTWPFYQHDGNFISVKKPAHQKPTPKKEGEVKVDVKPKQEKKFNKSEGDYIDFEEINED